MKELDKDFTVDSSLFEADDWYKIMGLFQDANLYQTWSYDMVRFGKQGVFHMVLQRSGTVVAAAQARIVRLPVIKSGIAYIMWGPMWRLMDTPEETEVFRQAVRALRNEFSLRRGLVLRVYPIAFQGKHEEIKRVLAEEGYQYYDDGANHRTLIIDLEPPLEEIRTALDPKWRNHLNRAEKNNLELIAGEEEGLFDEIKKIYMEMVRRKGLVELSNIDHLKIVQRDLPPDFKLKVILCRLNGKFCAGAIFSAVGRTAEYLVGATSDDGMKAQGSYLIQWTFVKWIKEKGLRFYDLTGINPLTNPGTYNFKRGLAGKHGMDVEFLGKFQVADSRVSSCVVKGAESLISGYKRIVRVGKSLRNPSER